MSVDGMDHPLLVRMPDGTAREAAGRHGRDGEPGHRHLASRSGTCGADCIGQPVHPARHAGRAARPGPPSRHRPVGRALRAVPPDRAGRCRSRGPPLLDLLRACRPGYGTVPCRTPCDAAVAARTPLICARVSPPALASHVVTAMRARVTRGMWMCLPAGAGGWLAPRPSQPAGGHDGGLGGAGPPDSARGTPLRVRSGHAVSGRAGDRRQRHARTISSRGSPSTWIRSSPTAGGRPLPEEQRPSPRPALPEAADRDRPLRPR